MPLTWSCLFASVEITNDAVSVHLDVLSFLRQYSKFTAAHSISPTSSKAYYASNATQSVTYSDDRMPLIDLGATLNVTLRRGLGVDDYSVTYRANIGVCNESHTNSTNTYVYIVTKNKHVLLLFRDAKARIITDLERELDDLELDLLFLLTGL